MLVVVVDMQPPRTCLATSLAKGALLALDISTHGQELGLALFQGSHSPSVPPTLVPSFSTHGGCAWLGAGAAWATVPAQGGVMLMLLPIPRCSRCRSASSPGHRRLRLCHGHLLRAAAWERGTGAASVPGGAREGADGHGGPRAPRCCQEVPQPMLCFQHGPSGGCARCRTPEDAGANPSCPQHC